jgi:alpha-beta hydrolase superfamily lysophospholipase
MGAIPVQVLVPNGPTLRGERHGDAARWAVLVHDEGEDIDAWSSLIHPLVRAGYSTLAFDLSGHGISDGEWDPARLHEHVLAVLALAQARGAERLYLVGAGAGATAAMAAAGAQEVRALVALSPRSGLEGLSPDAIRRSRAPKLVIAGSKDTDATEQATWVARRVLGWCVQESPPVSEQGTALLRSAWGDHVREHVLAFLRDYP